MRWALALVLALLVGAACSFAPDLSRFPPCGEGGACEAGWTCLASEARCIPDCGEKVCEVPAVDGGDAGEDGGTDAGEDGGTDAGDDGGVDAGTVLSLVPDSLPPGLEDTAYSGTLRAQGGTPPYSFQVTSTLPAGLTFTSQGEVSGTPAVDGEFFISVRVEDRSSPQAQQAFGSIPLRVRQKLRLAGPGILADAPLNIDYVEQLSATGGTGTYTFSLVTDGGLPPGLSLGTNGEVTGRATGGQVLREFTVRVTDNDTPPQEATRELEISTVDTGLLGLGFKILTRSLPDARSGTPYHYVLRRYGGSQWSVRGPLPPGIQFNATTGVLSGTPPAAADNTTSAEFDIVLGNGLGATDTLENVTLRVNRTD
jgi:hypothetical protein